MRGAAKLAGRQKNRGGGKTDGRGLLQTFQEQGQGQSRRVGRKTAGVNRSTRPRRRQPGCADYDAGLLIERAGEIEDRRAGAQRIAPVLAGQCLRSAEESKVDALECVCGNGLDDGDLVANLVKLTLRLFFVEQHKVGRRQWRLGEGFLQLPAYQG